MPQQKSMWSQYKFACSGIIIKSTNLAPLQDKLLVSVDTKMCLDFMEEKKWWKKSVITIDDYDG